MSTSYTATTYLGIPVHKSDFVFGEQKTELLCEHPEGENTRFCPVCGLEKGKRSHTTTKETWHPHVKPFIADLADADEEPLDFDVWVGDCEGTTTLGVQVLELAEGYKTSKYILGVELSSVELSSVGDCGRESVSWEGLQKYTIKLLDCAAKLQIENPKIRLYTNLSCG